MKKIHTSTIEQSPKKKGKKLQFSLEVVEIPVPRKPFTKAVAKRLQLEKPSNELAEPKEIQAQTSYMDEKDKKVKELEK